MATIDIPERSYAVGVQLFDRIRESGAPYVDKTALVYRMVKTNAVNFFLSRPRRFGKSLLVDTLRCYFEGRKELFEGLAIYDLEKEWKKYPVIRLDLSNGKYYDEKLVHGTVNFILEQQEKRFGITNPKEPENYDGRLSRLIETAYDQTGEKVVVLIDEYDAPMLDSIGNPTLQDAIRNKIRNLFSPLKAQSQFLRFVFLTGISKFSQLSVFSELNNLQQMTFDPAYEAICGITEEELLTQMKPDIEQLTEKLNRLYKRWDIHYTYDKTVAELKHWYDGYHFSVEMTDVYCPWSLLNAFQIGDIQNYWFSTGTPTMLVELMKQHNIILPQLVGYKTSQTRLEAPTETITDIIPVLFQSGYITLKDYDPRSRRWMLGFPNEEVYRGFADVLYTFYMPRMTGSEDLVRNAFDDLRFGDIGFERFLETIKRWYAGIPYGITYKNSDNEQFYQALLYSVLAAVGADVDAEVETSDGRMDIVLKMQDAIYILELKYDKTVAEATQQILTKDYAVKFASDERPVYAVGLNVSADHKTIDSYELVKCK